MEVSCGAAGIVRGGSGVVCQYPVARGFSETSHRPVRLRSSRKPSEPGIPDTPSGMDLGLLRNPTGINPLATGFVFGHKKTPLAESANGVFLKLQTI
ncbi:hypothetical protein GRW89_06085 [Pseudomonas moraviensis]|uniref:hypothetical protein n=1 Tax=Pseudomonas TaxID=286 RepID=UPI00135DAE2B|nr:MULTISPECIES: hypothetical protein [Pseudomonas]MXI46073.1 hypothetical protein [Pseudomonas moraviensis]